MGFRVEYPILPLAEGEIMPSGRCPFCKRHTIFSTQATVPPPVRNYLPHGVSGKRGIISLAKCGHQDCQATVYREYNPDNDEVYYDIYPPIEIEAEEELEGPVKRSYQEALNVFADGHWTAAVQALGRTLHDATAQLRPEGVKQEDWLDKKAFNRIEALSEAGALPGSMKQWLHEIRQSRIWATHGDEYADWWAQESDALEALEFTKWFLRFTFILPAQLRKRRERLKADTKK